MYPSSSWNTTEAVDVNVTPATAWASESPRRDSLFVVVPITVLYSLILISGVLGNVVTCLVIARNRHMHTATNYYLFSLACSDLLLLLAGLPQEMYYIWSRYPYIFGEVFCIVQGFAAETSANATVLTITAFTVERYVAICHPFLSHNLSKLSRAVRLVVVIWLLALILAVPQAAQFGVVGGEFSYCTIKWVLVSHAFEISTVVFFVAPMTLITALYVLIGLKLRRSRLLTDAKRGSVGSGSDRRADPPRSNTQQNYVIRMLVAVVVGFFICWAPFHAQRLLAVYASEYASHAPGFMAVYTSLTYISGVLYYLSTTINPILYHTMSHKFRTAFKSTLAQLCGRGRKHDDNQRRTYSVLSRYQNNQTQGSNQHRPSVTDEQRKRMATLLNNHNNYNQEGLTHHPPHGVVPLAVARQRGGSESSQATMTTSIGRLSLEGAGRVSVVAATHEEGTKVAEDVESGSISNSSLQDLDDMEFSQAELAHYMGELNKR